MNQQTLKTVEDTIKEHLKSQGLPCKGLDVACLLPLDLLRFKFQGYLVSMPGTDHIYSVNPSKWWNLKYYSELLQKLDLVWDGRDTVTDLRKLPSPTDDPSQQFCNRLYHLW